MKRILIILLIIVFVVSGCSSTNSYNSCSNDCKRLQINNFCGEHGGDSLFENACIDGTSYNDKVYAEWKEVCFNECK